VERASPHSGLGWSLRKRKLHGYNPARWPDCIRRGGGERNCCGRYNHAGLKDTGTKAATGRVYCHNILILSSPARNVNRPKSGIHAAFWAWGFAPLACCMKKARRPKRGKTPPIAGWPLEKGAGVSSLFGLHAILIQCAGGTKLQRNSRSELRRIHAAHPWRFLGLEFA
jgi:hypothetical protein